MSPVPFSSEQGQRDIYAARLDAAGSLLDATPIIVNQEFGNQEDARASWNGQNWLVVWENQSPTQFFYASGVLAARVALDGSLLDPTPLILHNYQNSSGLSFDVTANGSEWLIVMQGTSAGETDLLGVRVAANGTILDPTPAGLVTGTSQLWFNIAVNSAGGEYLLSYTAGGTNVGRRYAADLTAIGSTLTLSGTLLASSGANYYLIWTSGQNYVGSPMATDGTLLLPSGAVLTNAGSVGANDLTWAGTQWWYAWDGVSGLQAQRIAPGGAVLDATGVLLDPGNGANVNGVAAAGGAAGELRLAWTDRRVGGLSPDDVYASSFSSSAVPGTETLVSTGAPSHLGVDAAPGPAGEFLTAYRSDVSGVQRILVQRVDGTGAPMDAFPTDVGNGSALSYPSVAWDGSRYLVVWGNGGNIYGRRVSAAGVPIDGAEFLIMPGVSPDVAGLNGRFAVVGAHWATSTQFYFPFGLRVDGATAALLDAPILLGQYFCRAPAVIAFDNRWLVMWQRNFSHDDVQAELSGAFLLQDGTPTTEFRNFGALGPGYTPSLATAGSEALVVYRTGSQSAADQSISALRVLPGAAAPLPTSHVISNAPDRQAEPSVTWTGTEYCAVWQDKRDAAFFFDERTNVYGARIDGAGTVLDPTGVPIETDAVPEALPLIVSDGTSSLFLSSRFESAAPFAAYLVGVRTLVAVTTAVPIGPVPGTALQLAPAAPNPFTATTSLRFTLPSAGAFRLDVYDIAGRHVRTLLNGTLPAGEHVTTWDGRSDEGAPLATGVYLVRLASDRGRRTERVLRLR